jgi:heme/copper-type cytochrome/quinol oxidase subunit 3
MIDKNRLGMMVFLASEVAFFGTLILAYIYFTSAETNGPNAANTLDPYVTLIFTIALLASSFTLWRAQKSIEHGEQNGLRMWLLATIVLGAIFIGGQGWEWSNLIRENVTIAGSLFGTTFFTLTGFHGLHVISGLIVLLVLLILALAGSLNQARAQAVATVELYWHFVDVVWIVIFSLLYVLPHL